MNFPVIVAVLVTFFSCLGYCQEPPPRFRHRQLPYIFCRQLGCSQACHVTDTGRPYCACMMGFQIQDDGISCQDIDECVKFPRICEHGCNNTVGSYICTCPLGYSLRNDGRTCREFTDYSETPCGRSAGSNNPCHSNNRSNTKHFLTKSVTGHSPLDTHQTRKSGEPCNFPMCTTNKDNKGFESDKNSKQKGITDIPLTKDNSFKDSDIEKTTPNTGAINENYIEEEERVDNSRSVPPCLGGDCDFKDIREVLTDCTGSGCPPKDNDWYETFLGIPLPGHNFFERSWQNDQANKRNSESQRQLIKEKERSFGRQQFLFPTQANQEAKKHDTNNKQLYATSLQHRSNSGPKHAKHARQSETLFHKHTQKLSTSKTHSPKGDILSDEPKCRDDLCIENQQFLDVTEVDTNHIATDFDCPPGYIKETRGKVTFCKPGDMIPETQKGPERKCEVWEQLVRTSGREFCVPMKPKQFHRLLCPKGRVPVPGDKGIECTDMQHKETVDCETGQVAIETLSGTICVYPQSKQNQIPVLGAGCGTDQVGIQTSSGFVCVDKVDPKPMCGPGIIPELRNGRLECGPVTDCPPGKVAIETDRGTVCQDVTSPPTVTTPMTPEQPCPYGLVPLHTPVGRVCQYLPQKQKHTDQHKCPEGQRIKNKDGTYKCIQNHQSDHLECPKGQLLINTEKGQRCGYGTTKLENCPTGTYERNGKCVHNNLHECPVGQIRAIGSEGQKCIPNFKECPFGFIMVDGNCQDLKRNNLCPMGQELVENGDGFDCIYRQEEYPSHGNIISKCGNGQVLSQAMRSFYCETHYVPLPEVIVCEPRHVFVKVGGGYACISEFEASLHCTETEVLIRLPDGFTCIPMKGKSPKKHRIPNCGPDEVQHTDKQGFQVCLSIDQANVVCGEGYKAIKVDKELVCRKEKLDLQCPVGFVLSFDGETPACVSEIDLDCIPLEGKMTPDCFEKFSETPRPPCENGYQLEMTAGKFECSIISAPGSDCSGETCVETDCTNQDGVRIRPCDIDPRILLDGCNPECANGGTCINGSCICPSGITGKACNEDENECLSLHKNACEYQCRNTFGSYQCTCPTGMTLHTDGRKCKANHCSPDCLNGGVCTSGRCRCPQGFKGDFCQTDINECELYGDRLCQYICRNTYGGYSCICPHGRRLNPDRRTCTNTTCIPHCRNGGECLNNKCVCAEGFYGRVCQLDINECYKFQPCSHSCVNLRGGYRCTCPEGYNLLSDQHTCQEL